MRAEQRLWRTADGRLVVDGDQDAAILAYAAGDDIAPADEAKMPASDLPDAPADAPRARRPVADKARRSVASKEA